MTTEGTGARVLVVDDDDTFRQVVSSELSRRGFRTSLAATGAEALEAAGAGQTDVILLDLRLPDMGGIEVLQLLRERETTARVVMLTGHGTIDTAVEAVRLGAIDYIEKPCPMDRVEMVVRRTHQQGLLEQRQRVLEDGYSPSDVEVKLVGGSPAIREMLESSRKMAATSSAVLILGETGVGKELVARRVHGDSPRRGRPFVVVDCAGLNEELLQSELFGHQKGAFTGASRLKHGLFEVANGGTIFLDEVGDTSPEVQAKLLRVLENGRFRRLGGTEEISVDVRVVSATNRDLKESVARGHFREDLYFRLATFTIVVPPLRQRPSDIPVLSGYFIARLNARFGTRKKLEDDAVEVLSSYAWPGNVRELIHVLEQVVILSDSDTIRKADLPSAVTGGAVARSGPDAEMLPLGEVERRHVLAVVERVGGNRAEAARVLQISERNLYRLLKKYGVTRGC